jgi:KDO2-lipid IV(A) lauroyltransferase
MPAETMKFRYYVEYALLRIIAFFARLFPYRISITGAWLLACILYLAFYGRVREAQRRIRCVFQKELSPERVREIAWLSFRNTFFSAVEMLRFPITRKRWVKSVFDCEQTMTTFLEHEKTGQGAVIAVPHTGSWELAGVATHLWGIPIFNFSGQQRNPLVNDYMNYLRASPGIDFVPRGSSVYRQAIRLLKSGRFCAILPDVRMRSGGIEVDFLRGKANIGTGAAFFARMADVPIFPCVVTRRGWFGHKIEIFPPISPDKSLDKTEDVSRMTRQLLKIMDETVQNSPEQWFWYNRRWILDPINE